MFFGKLPINQYFMHGAYTFAVVSTLISQFCELCATSHPYLVSFPFHAIPICLLFKICGGFLLVHFVGAITPMALADSVIRFS